MPTQINFHTSPNLAIIETTNSTLTLRVRCEPGYQSAFLKLRPGGFDTSLLDIQMDEFPSGREVLSQGWDLHQYDQVMAVPVFVVFQDDVELGDVWFDVPNYQDHARGVLDTEFGFYVEAAGEVELRLEIAPRYHEQLRWDRLETLTIEPDDRAVIALAPRRDKRDEPYLFLGGRSVELLRDNYARQTEFTQSLDIIREMLESWDGVPGEKKAGGVLGAAKPKISPPAYVPIEQVAAAAALVTNDAQWIEIARDCLKRLCEKATWSQQADPKLMGGDNDLALGHPLLSVAMLVHFLGEHLSDEERTLAREKARENGRKLYEFSVLQKRWATGMGHITSHESGPLLGLGAAAMVFWDEIPEAARWLAWTHGRMQAGVDDGPQDGRHAWPTYGPNFHVFYAAAIYDFAGVNWFNEPFIKNLPGALLRTLGSSVNLESDLNARWILAFYGAYQQSAAAIWGWQELWKAQSAAWNGHAFVGWQDLLWHTGAAGAKPDASFLGSHLFEDTGLAVMRAGTPPHDLSVQFQCGVGVGRKGWKQRKRYGLELHDAHADGGISVFMGGTPIIAPAPSQYRRGFSLQSVVCVEGGGHYMDDRVLGTRIEEDWLSEMPEFEDDEQSTRALGDNTGAYREALGVVQSQRRVQLWKDKRELVVEDTLKLRDALDVAARWQCTGAIAELGAGRFLFTGKTALNQAPAQLEVVVSEPEKYEFRIVPAQMVLHYIYGHNVRKGEKTAGLGLEPPRPVVLEIGLPEKVSHAEFRVTLRPVA